MSAWFFSWAEEPRYLWAAHAQSCSNAVDEFARSHPLSSVHSSTVHCNLHAQPLLGHCGPLGLSSQRTRDINWHTEDNGHCWYPLHFTKKFHKKLTKMRNKNHVPISWDQGLGKCQKRTFLHSSPLPRRAAGRVLSGTTEQKGNKTEPCVLFFITMELTCNTDLCILNWDGP